MFRRVGGKTSSRTLPLSNKNRYKIRRSLRKARWCHKKPFTSRMMHLSGVCVLMLCLVGFLFLRQLNLFDTAYYQLHRLAWKITWLKRGGVRRIVQCQEPIHMPSRPPEVSGSASKLGERIAVVSLYHGHFSWAGHLSDWNKRVWSQRHNYHFIGRDDLRNRKNETRARASNRLSCTDRSAGRQATIQ